MSQMRSRVRRRWVPLHSLDREHPPTQALGLGLSRTSSPRRARFARPRAAWLRISASRPSMSRSRWLSTRSSSRRRACCRPRRWPTICCHRRARARLACAWQVLLGCRARLPRSLRHPPDFVAHPREEADVERVLEWCAAERVAAIPYGGGTSVVGGVEPARRRLLQRRHLDRPRRAAISVLEVDEVSRAARIQGGASGPGLEAQLAEHGLTLRHFPQSFELSTLGGWIATRAAGHFATVWTHIEDFVESVRAITPVGRVGVAAAARVGRRPEPRSDARRLGGQRSASSPRHGCACSRAPPTAPRRACASPRFVGRRRVRARALPVGPAPEQLPSDRPRRGALHDGRRRYVRAAGARLRVLRPPGRRLDGPGACDLRRAWRRPSGA